MVLPEKNLAPLIERIADLLQHLPPQMTTTLCEGMRCWDVNDPQLSKARILAVLNNKQVRNQVHSILNYWENEYQFVTPEAFALALQTSLEVREMDHTSAVELVWTGPETNVIPLRKTEQALLQVIQTASEQLLIVSFAVYRIASVVAAIEKALQNGVDVNIVVEDHESSGGKPAYIAERAFGYTILDGAKLFHWPIEKRNLNQEGRFGSLHAKLALADQKLMFISSANLTEYAMELNMELGVLISDGDLPGKVARHFEELIQRKVLVRRENR